MKQLKESLTRRANALVEQRKKEIAEGILEATVDAGSLKTYTELGYNEQVGYSEEHPEGVVYHKIRNINGMMDRDAYDLAKSEADRRGHATVLIGGSSPLAVDPSVAAKPVEEPVAAPATDQAPTPIEAEPKATDPSKADVKMEKSGKRLKVGVKYNDQWVSVYMEPEPGKALARKLRMLSPKAAYKLFKKTTQAQGDKGEKKAAKK